jgi:hypothetical protein
LYQIENVTQNVSTESVTRERIARSFAEIGDEKIIENAG